MKKNFFLILKLSLLIILIIWLTKIVDFKEAFKLLTKASPGYLFIGIIFSTLSHFFLAFKWYRLAKPLGIKSNFVELLKLNYISMFYSIFVPGQTSGELIKGIKLQKKEKGSVEKIWAPIILDKATNLLIIFIIGGIGLVLDDNFRENKKLIFSISAINLITLFFTVLLFTEKIDTLLNFVKTLLIKIFDMLKINSEIIKNFSLTYFQEYKNHKLILFETLFWSFMTKAPHVFSLFYLALSLNIKINLIESAWLFSVISLASLLPISFCGLGVREGTLIVLMGKIGIESSSALSYSLLIFIIGIFTSLIGGIIEFYNWFNVEKKESVKIIS